MSSSSKPVTRDDYISAAIAKMSEPHPMDQKNPHIMDAVRKLQHDHWCEMERLSKGQPRFPHDTLRPPQK